MRYAVEKDRKSAATFARYHPHTTAYLGQVEDLLAKRMMVDRTLDLKKTPNVGKVFPFAPQNKSGAAVAEDDETDSDGYDSDIYDGFGWDQREDDDEEKDEEEDEEVEGKDDTDVDEEDTDEEKGIKHNSEDWKNMPEQEWEVTKILTHRVDPVCFHQRVSSKVANSTLNEIIKQDDGKTYYLLKWKNWDKPTVSNSIRMQAPCIGTRT